MNTNRFQFRVQKTSVYTDITAIQRRLLTRHRKGSFPKIIDQQVARLSLVLSLSDLISRFLVQTICLKAWNWDLKTNGISKRIQNSDSK